MSRRAKLNRSTSSVQSRDSTREDASSSQAIQTYSTKRKTSPPNLGKDEKDPTHTANFGVKLKEHCDAIKAPCELVYPGAPNIVHATDSDFIKAHLIPSAK